ncbi:MAG: DUF5706 domain-containing protein [Porticoccus sp.]|nr:DUF5706 domain-containing protein [Porticoccus sp.]
MNSNSTQSLNGDAINQVAGAENPGSLTGQPSVDLPESAISTEKLTSTDLDLKIAFADETHTYIREYIQSADQKATFYFAAFAAIIAYSDSLGYLQKWIVGISSWSLIEAASFISTLLLLLSAFGCLWVVKPNITGSKRGIIFFNAIAEFESQSDFFNEIASTSSSKLYEEKIKHTFEIAKVCAGKFKILGLSLWAGGIGFALLILLMLFA